MDNSQLDSVRDLLVQASDKAAAFDEHRFVHESMIEICDLISEGMAASMHPNSDGASARAQLEEINAKVWGLRWELRMTSGMPVSIDDEETANDV